ncbi:glycine zipper family protein [Vibrio penaeicida]|uniref:Glycine zipper family protein n=1 Tax=Vibrio penaeicida TaxID=104609 RepID=A0AAV5NXE9_9VIBR|nr:glycine zipper family protein [Vibrio penaeicida]RTZ22263.1 glycine zipper family protein [Vibrio penaeicida]GLQ74944.1 hypothetical protein GCM10007932_43060 [Vibrio penaeicida]
MKTSLKSIKALKTVLIGITLVGLTGCASPEFSADDENAARNRGTVGGALLGATAGLLLGSPELAAKGAIAGGVAGGVSGSMKDLEDSRSADRNQVMADGVSQDTRSDAERRAAELEAELRIIELEKQLNEMKAQQSAEG